MKVALPVDSMQGLGGGFSFQRNLKKGLELIGHEVVASPLKADIALIAGATMITKETFRMIRDAGVPIVTRLDNVPRNSRNRGVGTSRLQNFSKQSQEVVWQGEWARYYLKDFIGKEGVIVHNGIDLSIFTPKGDAVDFGVGGNTDNVYLYSRYSRDETKHWETAWYEYQLIQRENKDAKLIIMGKFSQEIIEYGFDFFRGENFDYIGTQIHAEKIAEILRGCGHLIATYYNDAFSNTYLEALCTGVKLYKPDMSGGTPEMLDLFQKHGREYFSLQRMAEDYVTVFRNVLQK